MLTALQWALLGGLVTWIAMTVVQAITQEQQDDAFWVMFEDEFGDPDQFQD